MWEIIFSSKYKQLLGNMPPLESWLVSFFCQINPFFFYLVWFWSPIYCWSSYKVETNTHFDREEFPFEIIEYTEEIYHIRRINQQKRSIGNWKTFDEEWSQIHWLFWKWPLQQIQKTQVLKWWQIQQNQITNKTHDQTQTKTNNTNK